MALTGNIADWSLADLLQIIAAERKSGTLTLRREAEEVHFDFAGGLLAGASEHRGRAAAPPMGLPNGYAPAARRQGASLLTGRRGAAVLGVESPGGFLAFLVTSGRVRPDQARAVILLAHETSADTMDALLKAEIMSRETLEAAMTAYAQDLFTRVLAWDAGDYTFAAASRSTARIETPSGSATTVALSTDGLLLEAMRRIDEQPRIAAVVQPETVFVRTDEEKAIPTDLGPREAALLALVDGRRDVRSLAPLAQLSEYEAAEAFFNLHQGRLVAARDGGLRSVPITASAAREPGRPRASLLQVAALALVLAVSLAFRLAGVGALLPGARTLAPPATLPAREEAALRFAEALFAAHHGRPAMSADELVRAGLLPGGFRRWDGAPMAPPEQRAH
jgi:hypothetical protein